MGFKIGKGNLMLICELLGTSFAENKVNGGEMADTAGLTLDVIGGLILQLGKMKVKAGVGIGVGDENFRGPGISPARYHDVSYDISPVLGITYFLK